MIDQPIRRQWIEVFQDHRKDLQTAQRYRVPSYPTSSKGKNIIPFYLPMVFNKTASLHGKKTSNGETYDMHGRIVAHKPLPIKTRLLGQNLDNSKETVVKINDREPFVSGRIIDFTHTAAQEIGMIHKGTAHVKITALGESVFLKSG